MVGIISSSLTTVFSCTWVATHPNVPGPKETSFEITLRRIRIMVMALITPELVIVWAMRQWFVAGRIARKYKARKWTRTHGFFTQMGGFMLEDDHGRPVRPLVLQDIEELDDSEFPRITEIQIQDRSKRDALSKAVIMVQTTWFILQCVARALERLPITELEIATLAFTVLNLATYTLWWSKPADVRCPYPIRKKSTPEVAPSVASEEDLRGDHEGSDEEDEKADKGEEGGSKEEEPVLKDYKEVNLNESDAERGEDDDDHEDGFLGALRRVYAKARNYVAEIWALVEDDSPFERIFTIPFFALPFAIITPFLEMTEDDTSSRRDPMRVPTFHAGQLEGLEETELTWISALLATAFGAVHCFAWNVQVPTHVQLLLWRVSSLTITIIPILEVFVYKAFIDVDGALGFISFMFLIAAALVYIVARVTLLVLAFTSLRSLPPGAYETVVWTTFIPHV
ncbi:hypothetical protein JAAARDRAFT_42852 [Jaapia argillacea MUCL 33604]|uniref:Uncharacterized protein n=1 Tax=Jaapia argillacea MUCL 33604 TaxID=933084 RepID=A0A067P3N8_9AGAM|nr:hypothetical protein JAAARDRAFT_42852 [Jaapia argillacea MUCL 33604]